MAFVELMKKFASAIILLIVSIISIGFSYLQLLVDENSQSYISSSGDDNPNNMLRSMRGSADPSYCGSVATEGYTTYRLMVALFTIFFSVTIFLRAFEERAAVLNLCFRVLYSLWFLAAGLDVAFVWNGRTFCIDQIAAGHECDFSFYGITIIVDVAACVLLCVFIYLQVVGSIGFGVTSSLPTISKLNNLVV
eukprot:gene14656-16256_t